MGLNRYHLLLVLPGLFWAGNALVGRATVGMVPPITLSFWRWAVAFVLILPFTGRQTWEALPRLRPHWKFIVVLSIFSVTAYNSLLYLALQSTTAINATLVAASMPVMILIIARFWLAEALGRLQAAGVAVSLAGVLAIITRGDWTRLGGVGQTGGDALVLAAVLSWAIYSVLLRRHPLPVGGLPLLTLLIAVGTVFIVPFYMWELAAGATMALEPVALGAILYTAIFPSILAYWCWNLGVGALGAGVAGQFTYLTPLFTALLAVPLLGEPFLWFHGVGGALIFAGLWLTARK